MPWGAAAAVVGAYVSSEASRDAAKKQSESAQNAQTYQERMLNRQIEQQKPYQDRLKQLLGLVGGGEDNGRLLRSFNANDLNSDVVYNTGLDFGLKQGISGINSRAAQAGGYDSGATLKALTRYANDYGNTKAGEAYNRFTTDNNNFANRLTGGQSAAAGMGSAMQNTANQVTDLITGSGNAQAADSIAQANSINSALGSLSGAYGNYSNQKWLQSLGKNKSSSPSNDDILQSIYYGQ